jgi:hypothetical protein
LDGPPLAPNAGTVIFGGRPHRLDSWRTRPVPGVQGLDVIGIVGADAFLGAPTELDVRRGRLVRHSRLPDEVRTWPAVPVAVKDGVLVTRARVNGYDLRLLLDTGSEDTIVMSGDVDEQRGALTTDALGNPIRLVTTRAWLAWERPAASALPVMWTRSFPAFEEEVATWGGMGGVLGMSALGRRRLVFDAAHGRVYVEPVVTAESAI